MRILDKYLIREHVGAFVFAITALTSLMLLQYIGKRLGDLVGKGLPWHVIVEFLLLSLPFTVAMTLPMAVLVAVLYAFSRLASENEITAMRANGVSMFSLMVPVIIGGTLMGLVMLVFNDQVLSRANHELATLTSDISRTKPTFQLKDQVINTVVDSKFYLRAAHIDHATSRMKDVVIYDLGDQAHRRTIYADRGTLSLAGNQVDLVLDLFDGMMLEVPTERPAQLTRLYFRTDQLVMKNVTNSFKQTNADSSSKGEREMTVCQMQTLLARADFNMRQAQYEWQEARARDLTAKGATNVVQPSRPVFRDPPGLGHLYCALVARLVGVKAAQAAEVRERGAIPGQGKGQGQQPPPKPVPAPQNAQPQAQQQPPPQPVLPLTELAGQEQMARSREKMESYQRRRYDIEIQKKFSLAAACIIFVLLGPPIALRFPRGGVGLVIGVSFFVFSLYYVGLIGGESLANKDYISPFWAMWGANMVLLAVGLLMVSRMNRVSGTTRGGDWSELRETARAIEIGRAHV